MTEQMNETLAARGQKQIISLDLDQLAVQQLFGKLEEFFYDWEFAKHITEQLEMAKNMHRSERYEGQEFKSVFTAVSNQEKFVKDLKASYDDLVGKYLEREGRGVDAKFRSQGSGGDVLSFAANDKIASRFFQVLAGFYEEFDLESMLHDQNFLLTSWMETRDGRNKDNQDTMHHGFTFAIHLVVLRETWLKFVTQQKNWFYEYTEN